MKRVYVAGKMSGLPDFGFPAFHAAAARLRAEGYEVVSPAELDETDGVPLGSLPWAEYLKRDIPQLLTCNMIALLPNWLDSKGARLEKHIADELGFEVIYLKEPSPIALAEEAAAERE